MSNLVESSCSPVELPAPRIAISIRPGTLGDIPFIDRLQKKHAKAVGFMHMKTLEGNIAQGKILIAEKVAGCELLVAGKEDGLPSLATSNYQPATTPLGYCLGSDRYFKHDDVGIIYQMNIVPEMQRSFVGAALLKAQFERSAYGCKLYCCWCAKDLGANRFWESMGFVPLAFRAGSMAKERVHIFWQKRIRSGDVTTPYWFPSKTDGGALREDRMVLPIPPGVHWSEVQPPVLRGNDECGMMNDESGKKALPGAKPKRVVKKEVVPALPVMRQSSLGSTLRFGSVKVTTEKPKKEPKPKVKLDPQMKEAARELRDRWLEQVNASPLLACGKYDVSRELSDRMVAIEPERAELKQLTAMAA
jgi:hypothetical protein